MSQYIIVDRLPTTVIYEPLVFNSTPFLIGQQGWLYYARSALTSPRPVPRSARTPSTCTPCEAAMAAKKKPKGHDGPERSGPVGDDIAGTAASDDHKVSTSTPNRAQPHNFRRPM